MEDDVRQFRDALFKALRAAPSAIAKRVGQITQTIKPPAISPKEKGCSLRRGSKAR
jgi:hypothetical protein